VIFRLYRQPVCMARIEFLPTPGPDGTVVLRGVAVSTTERLRRWLRRLAG